MDINDSCYDGVFLLLRKIDDVTGEGLQGAAFSLLHNGKFAHGGVTDADGCLKLRVWPRCSYILKEKTPPVGYEPNPETYTVHVDRCANIYINGVKTRELVIENHRRRSCVPVIDQIIEECGTITGSGTPGAEILVTFPGGVTAGTTVGSDGSWSVSIPTGVLLRAGDSVFVVQTEPGKEQSESVTASVEAAPSVYGYKRFRNITRDNGYSASSGDYVMYILTVGNEGSTSSIWPDVVITDVISGLSAFIKGSVWINGKRALYGTEEYNYSYDDASRELKIRLGDVKPNNEFVITFLVRLRTSLLPPTVSNSFEACPDPALHASMPPSTHTGGEVVIATD